jgi:hypothetical protein
MFDQLPQDDSPQRPPLAPPNGPTTAVTAIFWNERELRAVWRLLIYLLFAALFILGESQVIRVLHIPMASSGEITAFSVLAQEITGIIAVFAAAAMIGKLEERPFGVYGLPSGAAFGKGFWQGAVWGITMIAAIIFLIRLFRGFSFGEVALRGPLLWGDATLWAIAFLGVGFFEEFLFRGYAQFTLAMGIGFWPAAVLLSAAFGALHLRNPGEGKVGALSVVVVGLFFCLTLRRTGNLWFAVGLHAAFDWGETFLFSVPDSGFLASGHLLNSSFHGPAWLTGGTIGPEGSVMAFVVVGIAAVLFVIVYPEKKESAPERFE